MNIARLIITENRASSLLHHRQLCMVANARSRTDLMLIINRTFFLFIFLLFTFTVDDLSHNGGIVTVLTDIIIIIKLYLYSTFHAKECSSKCFTANT